MITNSIEWQHEKMYHLGASSKDWDKPAYLSVYARSFVDRQGSKRVK